MTRSVAFLALFPLLGCVGEVSDQADQNAKRIAGLEAEVASLSERVLANQGVSAANTTAVAQAASEAAAANQGVAENGALISGLSTRVDGHDAAIGEGAAALAGLEMVLFEPEYGEIPQLRAEIDANREGLASAGLAIEAGREATAANTGAIASLGATVAVLQPTVAANTALAVQNAADIADSRVDIDANTADIFAQGNTLANQQAAMTGLQAGFTALEAEVDSFASAVGANSSAIALAQADILSNASAIGAQSARIDANAAGIATNAAGLVDNSNAIAANSSQIGLNTSAIGGNTAAIAANTSAIGGFSAGIDAANAAAAANAADIATIQTNTVGPVDELLTYVSVDAASDTIDISAADLVVDGRIFSDTITYRKCDGINYTCTPKACLSLCQSNGERLATTDEVLAWASRGQNNCQWQWMVDRNNPSVPVRGFPMYFNRTAPGCGPVGTGDVPRFGEGPNPAVSWDSAVLSNCACASN